MHEAAGDFDLMTPLRLTYFAAAVAAISAAYHYADMLHLCPPPMSRFRQWFALDYSLFISYNSMSK